MAFQLTNIIRDVGEDARRDRVYLRSTSSRAMTSRLPTSCTRAPAKVSGN